MPLLILISAIGALYWYGTKTKPSANTTLLGMTTPAWALVANATIDAKQKPKNTAAVVKILNELAVQSVLTPLIAASFVAASLAVKEWQAGKLSYDVYRSRLIAALPVTEKNPSVKALLGARLPG